MIFAVLLGSVLILVIFLAAISGLSTRGAYVAGVVAFGVFGVLAMIGAATPIQTDPRLTSATPESAAITSTIFSGVGLVFLCAAFGSLLGTCAYRKPKNKE